MIKHIALADLPPNGITHAGIRIRTHRVDDDELARLGSRTGSDLSSRLLRIEKMAVFAPMPSANEMMATADSRGAVRIAGNASRISCMAPRWSYLTS
jgi:hypothetical protein